VLLQNLPIVLLIIIGLKFQVNPGEEYSAGYLHYSAKTKTITIGLQRTNQAIIRLEAKTGAESS
jgi:hypothetical protein